MANIYINGGDGVSTGYYAVTPWSSGLAASSAANGGRGTYVRQLAVPALNSERVFRCTTSGTTQGAEPTWLLTKNGVTTESTGVVWTECTGQEADQTSGNWTAPHARLSNATAATWSLAGDTCFVASTHAESQTNTMMLQSVGTLALPNYIISVNQANVPPTSANIVNGAKLTVGGTPSGNSFTINGFWYISGFIITTNSTNYTNITVGGAAGASAVFIANTTFVIGTNATALNFSSYGSVQRTAELNNVIMQYNVGSSPGIGCSNVVLTVKNSPNFSGISGTSNFPYTAFTVGGVSSLICDGIDFTNSGTARVVCTMSGNIVKVYFKDCNFGTNNLFPANTVMSSSEVQISRCSGAGILNKNEKYTYQGSQLTDLGLIRTGGANNGVTGYSYGITALGATRGSPYDVTPSVFHNTVVNSAVSVSVDGIWFPSTGALPTNADIWIDSEYMSSTTSNVSTFKTSGVDVLSAGTAWAASNQAWDSNIAGRGNSAVYAVGTMIRVASNPNRVFICTVAGTSAATEPVAFSTTIDGITVIDGTATFQAAVRFTMKVLVSSPNPTVVGYIYVYPKVVKSTSKFWLCPKITVG